VNLNFKGVRNQKKRAVKKDTPGCAQEWIEKHRSASDAREAENSKEGLSKEGYRHNQQGNLARCENKNR